MKKCSQCKRTYDDSFSFCVVDGIALSAAYDPDATLIMNEATSQLLQNRAGIRFIKKGRRRDKGWAGMIVELGVSDVWSELLSIDDYYLPSSNQFTLPDSPYLVHISGGSLEGVWVVYLPKPEDALTDWPPIQVRSRVDNASGNKTRVGFGILTTVSIKQNYNPDAPPIVSAIKGEGLRLLDDVANQRTLSSDGKGNTSETITVWIVSAKPFC